MITMTGSCFHLAWLTIARQIVKRGTKMNARCGFIVSLQVVIDVAFESKRPYKTVPTVMPKPRNNE